MDEHQVRPEPYLSRSINRLQLEIDTRVEGKV